MAHSPTPRALNRIAVIGLLALASTPLGGCTALLFGGVASVATAARQERPVDVQLDDAALQANLEANLIRTDGHLFRRVDTTVIEGRVYLKGRVPTEADRARAAEIAWSTPDVREVFNDITVGDGATLGNAFNDMWLSTKVRGALLGEGDIKDVNYTIETRDGVVYLMGIAQNEYERRLAVDTARGVEGVEGVVDYLVLKDDPRRPASALAAEMEPNPRAPIRRTDKGQPHGMGADPRAGTQAPADAWTPATGEGHNAPIEIRPLPSGS